MAKYVYFFGGGKAEGRADMKNLLGGKGANLAEMTSLGMPVPPGFTITTEVCTEYLQANDTQLPRRPRRTEVKASISRKSRTMMGKTFGDADNPLLVSVRSGARVSMPGMMDTVLNLGLNDETVQASSRRSRQPALRLRQPTAASSRCTATWCWGCEGRRSSISWSRCKKRRGVKLDTDLTADDLKELVAPVQDRSSHEETGKRLPGRTPWSSSGARSTRCSARGTTRAPSTYRQLNDIPADWGTAVNVQTMVFGNIGATTAPPAWPSPATRPPARTTSTAST